MSRNFSRLSVLFGCFLAFTATSHAAQTAVNIAAGSGGFTLQIVAGEVWSWGNNGSGQLGDGTFVNHGIAEKVPGLSSVVAVAAGGSHSLALKTDGTVWAWGGNSSGQLGDGTFNFNPIPTQVPGLTGMNAIAAGQNHSLALKSDGTVWAWGGNFNGQVGDNTSGNVRLVPTAVSTAGGLTGVIAIAAGLNHSLAIKTGGGVWAWGQNTNGQVGDGTSGNNKIVPTSISLATCTAGAATAIAGGNAHSLAVVGGVVCAWGLNGSGQLGDNSITQRTAPVATNTLTGITAVAGGGNHSLAVKGDGTVWAWGSNFNGQLGDTTTTDQHVPVQSFGITNAIEIAAAGGYSVARLSSPADSLLTWGVEGALGDGIVNIRAVPIQISGFPATVTQASAGNGHTLALLTSGAVWGLGSNSNGQLGDNSTTRRLTPVQASGLTANVTAIEAGNLHSLARKNDGSVWAWGGNNNGQLGNNTTTQQLVPVQVLGVGGSGFLSNIVGISASGTNNFSLAVDNAGAVYAWGFNGTGQLGDNTSTQRTVPVQVVGVGNVGFLTAISAVAAGNNHSLALKNDGTVYAWGNNGNGQLGIGTVDTNPHFSPVQVPGLTGVVAIYAGNQSSFALKGDGSVWAWGSNNADPDSFQQPAPAPQGLPPVLSLAAGNSYALFKVQIGGISWVGGWGQNNSGQLGTGTFDFSNGGVPALGFGGKTVNSISANSHSLAVMTDGTLWGWGLDNNGQLGDQPTIFQKTPTAPVSRTAPDLTITKSHSSEPGAGSQYSYTITVKNVGGSTMNGSIVVNDTLPAGMSFASGVGAGWACGAVTGGASCTNANAGGLAAGASSVIALSANSTALMFPDQFNLATVSTPGGGDVHALNNVTGNETGLSTLTTVSLTPAPSPNPSTFGQSVSVNATVTPLAATGTVVFVDSKDSGALLGTAALIGGHAHVDSIMLPAGPRQLLAAFLPDSNTPYSFSFAAPTLQVVNAVPSASLAAFPSNLVLGGSKTGYLVANADFNNDGKMDIAVVDAGSQKVIIYLGNGNGGFTPSAGGPFSTGSSPVAIVAVDLNRDNKTDLVLANQGGANAVTVLLGNGAGGFAPAPGSPFGVGFNPTALAVSDLNDDGTLRVAVVGLTSTQFAKLKHGTVGSTGFFFVNTFPLPSGSRTGVASADFNGDGVFDLAESETAGTIGVDLKDPNGGYIAHTTFPSSLPHPQGIVAADVDGNGKTDLIVWDATGIEIMFGNGSGGFTEAGGSPFVPGPGAITGINSVQVGDFNGDGKVDLFVVRTPTSTGKGEMRVLLGNGAGGFASANPAGYAAASSSLVNAIVGEFNGDGRTDVAVTDPGNDAVVILRGVAPRVASKVGIWRPNLFNMVSEDVDGNIAWDSPPDQANFFGATGDTVIFGDWDGSGKTKMGIFRITNGAAMFALDLNGNGAWDPGIDQFGFFGQPGDIPIVGDWTGDGKSKIGVYRPTTGLFALDVNGNLNFDGGVDRTGKFGAGGDTPIVGDWTGSGVFRVGTFKNGLWSLDVDNTLTISAGDSFGVFGANGDTPLLGDWNGDGKTKVGIYRATGGIFGLDINGNLTFDGLDKGGVLGPGGAGVTPVVGDWDGTGITRVGIFYGLGYWALDINGNVVWDAGIKWGALGAAGDTAVVGKW